MSSRSTWTRMVAAAATLAAVAAAPAGAAVIGGQATTSPAVAVDAGGTGHVAWFSADGANDVLRYCRLAPASTACSPTLALRTAGPTNNRLTVGRWPVVFAPRAEVVAVLGVASLEVSRDGGSTFRPEPISVPSFSPSQAAGPYGRSTAAMLPGRHTDRDVDLLLGWGQSGVDIRAIDVGQGLQVDQGQVSLPGQGTYGAVGVTPAGRPFAVSRTSGSPGRAIMHTYRGPLGPDGKPAFADLLASANWQPESEVFPQGPPQRNGTANGFGRGFHVDTAGGATWLTEYGSDLDFRLGEDGAWARGPAGNPQAQSVQHTSAVGPDGRLHVATGACYQRTAPGFGSWEPVMTLEGLPQINYLAADMAAGPNGGGFLVAPGGDQQIVAAPLGQGSAGCGGGNQGGGDLPPVPPEFGTPPTITATFDSRGGGKIEITVVCTSTLRDCRYELQGKLETIRNEEAQRAAEERAQWDALVLAACGPRPAGGSRTELRRHRRCRYEAMRSARSSRRVTATARRRGSSGTAAPKALSRTVSVKKGDLVTLTLNLSKSQVALLKKKKVVRLRLEMKQTNGKDSRTKVKGYVFAKKAKQTKEVR